MTLLDDNWLLPTDANVRPIAQRLFASIHDLPLVSPHGHSNPRWFAEDAPFSDPVSLFILPDHYVFRMLYSQGVSLEDLEIGVPEVKNPRRVWRIFAEHYTCSAERRAACCSTTRSRSFSD